MSGFPQHFLWGAATAAWQVEGGHDATAKALLSGILIPTFLAPRIRGRPVTSPLTTTIVFAKTWR